MATYVRLRKWYTFDNGARQGTPPHTGQGITPERVVPAGRGKALLLPPTIRGPAPDRGPHHSSSWAPGAFSVAKTRSSLSLAENATRLPAHLRPFKLAPPQPKVPNRLLSATLAQKRGAEWARRSKPTGRAHCQTAAELRAPRLVPYS